MNFLEPQETAWDLRWRMFGVPVRVHPAFWIVMALMGQSSLNIGPLYLVIWVLCAFVSVLVHELGHVLVGSAFGSHGHIVLYSFGGLAIGSNRLAQRWQRIAVSFAGPGAGFAFLAAILGVLWLLDPNLCLVYVEYSAQILGIPLQLEFGNVRFAVSRPVQAALFDLTMINLFWGLINLLPIWPLDGGMICRELCEAASPSRGLRNSLMISIAVAGVIAVNSAMAMYGRPLIPWLFGGSIFTALMFGLLAIQNYQILQQVSAQSRWMDDHWQ